jgi:hypothetical protein
VPAGITSTQTADIRTPALDTGAITGAAGGVTSAAGVANPADATTVPSADPGAPVLDAGAVSVTEASTGGTGTTPQTPPGVTGAAGVGTPERETDVTQAATTQNTVTNESANVTPAVSSTVTDETPISNDATPKPQDVTPNSNDVGPPTTPKSAVGSGTPDPTADIGVPVDPFSANIESIDREAANTALNSLPNSGTNQLSANTDPNNMETIVGMNQQGVNENINLTLNSLSTNPQSDILTSSGSPDPVDTNQPDANFSLNNPPSPSNDTSLTPQGVQDSSQAGFVSPDAAQPPSK